MNTYHRLLLAIVIPLGILSKLTFWFLAITFAQTVIQTVNGA